MKGFIVHPTYKTVGKKAFVHLYGRLESGESFLTINEFKPYFFIRSKDLQKALGVQSFIHQPCDLKDFKDELVTKIVMDVPSEVKQLRDRLADKGIHSFEADIRFEYRFMIDHLLQGAIDIVGESRKGKSPDGEFVDLVFEEPKLSPADYFPKNLRTLSIDIETDIKGKHLYALSMVCGDYRKVLIISDKKLKNSLSFHSEEELLAKFREIVYELDPDIMTGWNVIGFDLRFIESKFRQHKIPFKLGRADETCRLRLAESFFMESKADIIGRSVLDGIQVLKNNFVALDDYKLDTAAKEFLKDSKLIEEDNKGAVIDGLFKDNPQLLADYNLKDSELVLGILEKSKALNLTIQRSLLTGLPLDRIRASIASLDSLYLKELRKRGYVAATAGFEQNDGEGKGGFVKTSKPGIYDYVIVCDFKSMYSSIIQTFNIDPLSYLPDCDEKNKDRIDKDKIVKAINGACFRNTEGILPMIIGRLWKQRDKARKEKNELARFAIKTLMNSFWGVLANPTCRFYNREMANAITLTGQHLIKLTASKIEEKGYEVIYGDTDSIFVRLDVADPKEAFRIGKETADEMNSFLEKHMKEEYHRKSYLELEFEKVYKRFIMPTVRGSDVGSKKRYAGLLIDEDGKEKMHFVGLEFVRRDWTELAKSFQAELLKRIFHKEEVAGYIKKLVGDVMAGKKDDLLVYRKAIRKEVEDYTKTTPPHVKAARLLGDDLKSTLIEYVMTVEGPEPIQKLKHRIDYDHYIEKQIKPIADSVLAFYNQSFDDILKGSSQKTLFGY